eukprot:5092636-Lingulodinium_polyedra.AAC.1
MGPQNDARDGVYFGTGIRMAPGDENGRRWHNSSTTHARFAIATQRARPYGMPGNILTPSVLLSHCR